MALTPTEKPADKDRSGSDEAFLREVDDAVRASDLTSLWKRYGRWLLAAVVAALLAFAGKVSPGIAAQRLDVLPFDSRHRFMAVLSEEPLGRVTHVKPHGALNNIACADAAVAATVARAVRSLDPALILLAPAGFERWAAFEPFRRYVFGLFADRLMALAARQLRGVER